MHDLEIVMIFLIKIVVDSFFYLSLIDLIFIAVISIYRVKYLHE